MTSRSLSYKTLVRRNLSSRLWAIALSILGCLSTLVFPVFVLQQAFAQRMKEYASGMRSDTQAEILHRSEKAIYSMLSYEGFPIKIVLCALAILCGVAMFRYLHDRQQVDFYHALPIKRGRLFILNYVSGILLVLPIFVVIYAISIAVVNGMGLGGQMTADVILQSVLGNIAHFLLNYTIAVLCTILTGNTIITVLLGIWVEFSVPLWVQMGSAWKSGYFKTYAGNSSTEVDWLMSGSPIIKYLFDTPRKRMMPFEAVQSHSLNILVYPLVLTLLLCVLSYVLFVCRKSERAGMALAFEPTKAPFQWYMCLFAGSAAALLFRSLFTVDGVWTWIGLVLGVVLCHAVVETIYEFDFKALFHHWKQMIALCIVAVAALLCVRADVFGYDRYLPKQEDIASVGFCDTGTYGTHISAIEEKTRLSDPESIRLVYEMAQKLVENTIVNQEETLEHDPSTSIVIRYTLKNGKQIARTYYTSYRLLGDAFDDLTTSEGYIKAYDLLHRVKLPENAENGEFVLSISTQMTRNSMPSDVTIDNAKDIQRVIDTLCEEQIVNARAHLHEIPVMCLEMIVWDWRERDREFDEGIWMFSQMNRILVYPSDTKTLELIQTLTGLTPIPVTADTLTSLVIDVQDPSLEGANTQLEGSTNEAHNRKTVSVTDPKILEQLTENLCTWEQMQYAGRHVAWENFEGVFYFGIEAQYKGDNKHSIDMYYPKGKAPIALLEELVGVSLTVD